MDLDKIQRSRNVEDRRRMSGGKKSAGGIGAIVMALIAVFVFKQDLGQVMQQLMGQYEETSTEVATGRPLTAEEQALQEHVEKVLKLTEDVWDEIYPYASQHFKKRQEAYVQPTLVSFTNSVTSRCGKADSGMGPFYCPGDQKVYIDLGFYDELQKTFKAPGDFAQAYVVAHEVGHHVQKLLGFSDLVHKKRQTPGVSKEEINQLSVKLELQADFFAGVWANRADRRFNILERGDIEEGLRAAGAVGDDKIQKRMQGYIVPESFTHGTAAQRIKWFTLGLKSGDPTSHNPFELPYHQL